MLDLFNIEVYRKGGTEDFKCSSISHTDNMMKFTMIDEHSVVQGYRFISIHSFDDILVERIAP